MTAQPASEPRSAARWDRLLLLVPPALVLLVAALTPTSSLFPDQGDVRLYLQKAQAVWSGAVPYRDVPFEYPPAALIPMVVPFAAGLSQNLGLDGYKVLFAGWEALLLLGLGFVLARIAGFIGHDQRAVGLRLIVLTIGALLAITWRFDLFPALLVAIAVWAALERRVALVGAALGLGFLAKLYPIAVLPALAIPWLIPFDLGRLARLAASFGLTVAIGLLPFVALAGSDAFAFLDYHAGRGLQIESIGGGVAILAGLMSGEAPALSFGFSAVQVEGTLAQSMLGILPVLTVLGFGLLAWLGWRRVPAEADEAMVAGSAEPGVRHGTLVTLALASLLVLLVTSKVFSIQYAVWIVPFVALLRGWQFWLGAAIVALTMPIHPVLYSDLVKQQALPILVLNLRNGLVLVLLVLVLRDLARSVARPAGLEPSEQVTHAAV
ncbi:MAG: glycosyltransferase family 87 protein [Chloroflexota bacterium]